MPKHTKQYADRVAQTPYAVEVDQGYEARNQARRSGLLSEIELRGPRLDARRTGLLDDIESFSHDYLYAAEDYESEYDFDEYEFESEYDFDEYESDSYVEPFVEEINEKAFETYTKLANQFVALKRFVASLSDKYTEQKADDYKSSSYATFMFKSPKPNAERLKQITDLKAIVKMFDKMEALTREPDCKEDILEYAGDIKSANRVIQGAIINLHDSLANSSYDSQLAQVLKPFVSECSQGVREAAEQAYKEHNHSIENLRATETAVSYSVKL